MCDVVVSCARLGRGMGLGEFRFRAVQGAGVGGVAEEGIDGRGGERGIRAFGPQGGVG